MKMTVRPDELLMSVLGIGLGRTGVRSLSHRHCRRRLPHRGRDRCVYLSLCMRLCVDGRGRGAAVRSSLGGWRSSP